LRFFFWIISRLVEKEIGFISEKFLSPWPLRKETVPYGQWVPYPGNKERGGRATDLETFLIIPFFPAARVDHPAKNRKPGEFA
jgi:hypothetical protein